MKEQTQSLSFVEITESQERRNSQMQESKVSKSNKTRPIHKERVNTGKEEPVKEEKNKLTREERAKIQKEKNKEAAQRSRDMHKEYVSNLEREVAFLREEINKSRRYCHRCQQILDSSECELLSEPTFPSNTDHSEHTIIEESFNLNQIPKDYSDPESFLRILQPHEESSIIKLMLFVCMIVIAVMVGYSKNQVTTEPRGLIQIYNPVPPETHPSDLIINQKCIEEQGLVQLHRGMQDQTCLDSLMTVEQPILHKSLRSIHNHNYSEEMDTIMLCSLKTPKVYQIKPEITDSPVVRLFVSGAEIKELVSKSGPWMNLLDRKVQLNGIYKLSAEIKSVDLVTHHQCLL